MIKWFTQFYMKWQLKRQYEIELSSSQPSRTFIDEIVFKYRNIKPIFKIHTPTAKT